MVATQFATMTKCGNCALDVPSTWKCNSCSSMVCGTCMPIIGTCCYECQDAFPAPPSTHKIVEPFHFILPCVVANPDAQANSQCNKYYMEDSFYCGEAQKNTVVQSDVEWEPHGCYPDAQADCPPKADPWWRASESHTNIETSTSIVDVLQTSLEQAGLSQAQSDGIIKHVKTVFQVAAKQSPMYESSGLCDASIREKALQCVDIHNNQPKLFQQEDCSTLGAKTMMICNIPCRVGFDDLIAAIESLGFGGTFEFVHLPCRFGQSDSNLGYGFINFFDPVDAEGFAVAFEGYRFSTNGSSKACTVKVATCQGYNANYRRMSRQWRLAQRESA